MKRFIIHRFLPLFAVMSILSVAHASEPSGQTIREGLGGTQIDSISPTPIQGIYQVKAGQNIFYSNNTGRYLFFGHLYDTATQTDLTTNAQGLPSDGTPQSQSASIIPWTSLPDKEAIITGKSGGIKVAVFLDPDCPYCKALQRHLLKNTVLEVHEFLMPIESLHPNAKNDSAAIWCSNNRAKTLSQLMTEDSFNASSAMTCDLSGLMNISQFATQHQFNATPILIRADGTLHYGYMPLSELTAWAMASNQPEVTIP